MPGHSLHRVHNYLQFQSNGLSRVSEVELGSPVNGT